MTKQLESDGISLDEQIAAAELEYVQACQVRQGSMSDKRLRDRVNELRDTITDLKRMRLDLRRIADKAANDARTARYQAKKAQDAADLKAHGEYLRHLDAALDVLVRKYLNHTPGSYCTSHINLEVGRIKSRLINESRRK